MRRIFCVKPDKLKPDDLCISLSADPTHTLNKLVAGAKPQVVPHPWSSNGDIDNAVSVCLEKKTEIVNGLALVLNEVFSTKLTVRQWDILLGPWATQLVNTVFDRASRIAHANVCYKNAVFVVDTVKDISLLSSRDFEVCATTEKLNSFLYEKIIKHMHLDVLKLEKRASNRSPENRKIGSVKKIAKSFRAHFLQIFSIRAEVGLYFTYDSRLKILSYFVRSFGKVTGISINWSPVYPNKDQTLRKKIIAGLNNKLGISDASLYSGIIGQLLPTAYVEGFIVNTLKARNYVRHYLPDLKVLCTGTGWYYDDAFKFVAAEHINKNGRLYGMQHGGVYGSAKYSSSESHELSITDLYFTWGWSSQSKCIPVPSPKLDRTPRRDKFNKRNAPPKHLFVSTCWYKDTFDFPYTPEYYLKYLQDQYKFFENLDSDNKRHFKLRRYLEDYGWGINNYYETLLSYLPIETWNTNYYDSLKSSRIAVFDHLSTTFLESLALGVPSIIYVNENIWPIRESLKELINRLREVNVFFDDPQSASQWLNDCVNIEEWWACKDVQDAVGLFVSNQALNKQCATESFYDILMFNVNKSN